MAMFDWTRLDAVKWNGVILSISAALSFGVYLLYAAKLSVLIDERKSIIFGITAIGIYYIITWPWPGLPGKLNFFSMTIGPAVHHNTTIRTSPSMRGSTVTATMYKWCYDTPPVPLWMYLGFWPLISIGYPAATVAISTLFARVLGPRRQGTMQGVMLAAGSLSRTIGPLSVSYLFQLSGPRGAWALCAMLGLVTLLPYPLFYKRLVSLQFSIAEKRSEHMQVKSNETIRNKF